MKYSSKSLSLLGTACLSMAAFADAAIIANDQFDVDSGDYSTGNLYDQNPNSVRSSGFSEKWKNQNSTQTSHLQVESTGLTIGNNLSFNENADGNIFVKNEDNGDGRRVTRAFDNNAISDITGTTDLYYSGLFRTAENPASNTGPVWFGIGTNADSNADPTNGIYFTHDGDASENGNGFRIWNDGAYESTILTPTVDTTYLFAIGIDFDNDEVSYEIFEDGDSEGSPTASGNFASSITAGNITHLLAGHITDNSGYTDNDATPRFDEFRLGTTRGDVVNVPEPGTYATMLGLLAIGLVFLRRRQRS